MVLPFIVIILFKNATARIKADGVDDAFTIGGADAGGFAWWRELIRYWPNID